MSSDKHNQYNLTVASTCMPRLTDRNDWDEWYTAFALIARSLDLWDYVTDEGPRKEFPARPEIPEQEAPPSRTATPAPEAKPSASRRGGRQASPRPAERTQPLSLTDYSILLAKYDRQEKAWKDLSDAKHKLLKWILDTVDRRLQNLHINRTDEVVQIIDNLRKYLRVTDSDRRVEIRQEYQAVLEKFGGSATKLQSWVRDWEDILKKGKDYGIPEAKDSETWLGDLLQACNKEEITRGWAQIFQWNKQALVHSGVLLALDVSYDLRNHLQQRIRNTQWKKKSGFPTYNEKKDDPKDTDEDESQPTEKKNKRQGHRSQPSSRSKKRRFSGSQQTARRP